MHRLERQVVPQYFSGKSQGQTPEKYMMLRNKVIAKYLERPQKRLVFAECQGLVTSTPELYDLSRIVRFLESWGIINYLATGSVHRGLRMAASLIKEETTGELQLVSAPMKSIDGLVLFDRPKCSVRADDIASVVSTSSASVVANGDIDSANLDEKIWERLSEASCSFCLQPLPSLHYESQKEVCAQYKISTWSYFILHILVLLHYVVRTLGYAIHFTCIPSCWSILLIINYVE